MTSLDAPPGQATETRPGWLARTLHDMLIPRASMGRKLALIAMINALGSGMFYTGSALYFTRIIGLQATQVGTALTLAAVVGFAFAVPIGMLADRLRAGRMLALLQAWRGLGYLAYCFVGTFPMFLVVACAIGIADTAVPPINTALIGSAVDEADRVDTLAKVRAVRNLGFGIGTLVAATAITTESATAFRALFAANAAVFMLAALLLVMAGATRLVTIDKASAVRRPSFVADLRYVGAALLNGVLGLHLTLIPLAVPLWLGNHTVVPVALFGLLYALNTVMAVVLQARMARPAETVPGAIRSMYLAAASLALFAVTMYVLAEVEQLWLGVALAVLMMALITFNELWQSAGGWTISLELARPDRRAQYLSTFQLGTTLQQIVAPVTITSLLLPTRYGWLALGIIALVAGAAIRFVVGRHEPPALAAA